MKKIILREFSPADLSAVVDAFSRSVREINSRDYIPEQIAAWAPDPPSHEG